MPWPTVKKHLPTVSVGMLIDQANDAIAAEVTPTFLAQHLGVASPAALEADFQAWWAEKRRQR